MLSPNDAVEPKAPADKEVYGFDWTSYLEGAQIQTSTFAITAESGGAQDGQLTKDSETLLGGNQKATVRIIGGTVGVNYRVVNHIVTNETPAREKDAALLVPVRL